MGFLRFLTVLSVGVFTFSLAQAGFSPPCMDDRGSSMNVNNQQVLNWKNSTPNQFKDRGYIQGTLVGVIQARPSHIHLDVFIGNNGMGTRGRDTDIEVIYNQEFGEVPRNLRTGEIGRAHV